MVKRINISKTGSESGDFTSQFAGAFHEIVVPVLEDINKEIASLYNKLSNKIDALDRKVTAVADHHGIKLDDHEKRIKKLERFSNVSS